MKYYEQVLDKADNPNITYKFIYDVDTKGGVDLYSRMTPPVTGLKYDTVIKKFSALSPTDLTTVYTAFDTDQKKIYLEQEWSIKTWWVVPESPDDDDYPPWPGLKP